MGSCLSMITGSAEPEEGVPEEEKDKEKEKEEGEAEGEVDGGEEKHPESSSPSAKGPESPQQAAAKPPEPMKIDIPEEEGKALSQQSSKASEQSVESNDSGQPMSEEQEKEEKAAHVRRVSSCGLQIESVLRKKTGNLKDHYTIGDKLGQGQFGTTYLCVENATGNEFACKTIAKRKLATNEDVEDIRREIEIMHHLKGHPSVISIKEAFEDAVAVHVIMELCSGGELFDRIVKRGHYSERKAAELARTIVGVVEECHSLGVMHRDLKPENFLFVNDDEDSPLKTIDFGLSIFFTPGDLFTDVVGSPYYVAPEILGKRYGPEADVWSAGVILYILLSGVPPFWGETETEIFQEVLNGEPDFTADPWPDISEEAKDLVQSMLDRDPEKRLTAHQALCNAWMADGVAPDKPLDPAVLTRLQQFSAMNKLKKMAIRVIAERLSEEEIAGLKEMFKMIDTDNSGHITPQELKEGLKKLGASLGESEILDLMKAADVNNSGTIDYGEFTAAMLHLNKLDKEDHLVAAFAFFDKDGSGYITRDELQQACQQYGIDEAHLEDTIKEVDQDNDGRIDYNEFVEMMQIGNAGFGRKGM